MQFNILIKGGTVVDGTGAPARKADVRISNGLITEVGPDLPVKGRERIVDAEGCYVSPGFIETHNHYDAPLWWMPNLEPMSGYGITTSVNGNCGFSAAPMSDNEEANMEMIKIFSFFEDIPIKPFLEIPAWDWKKWSEYKDSMQRNLRMPVNMDFYCGHQALRLAAMGLDARERAATPQEIAVMADLLRDALAAGALGFSSNTMDYDGQGRPVPSLLADDAEFSALFDVLDEFPGKTFQILLSVFMRMTGVSDMQRLEPLLEGRKFKVMWAGVPTLDFQMPKVGELWDFHKRYKEEGRAFYTAFHHVPPATAINFHNSLTFAQSNILVWHELIEAKGEAAKLALLNDDAWRTRARDSWDQTWQQSSFNYPQALVLSETESGYGPIGCSLADFMTQRDIAHPSDGLAEWLIDNGFGSTLSTSMKNDNQQTMIGLLKDDFAIGNISDSGAHGQMLCGIGDHIDLITKYARDNDWLSVAEAVHNCTGKLAGFFGFADRGVIEVGRNADIAVWSIDEIERRPTIKVFDVPDGTGGRTWRYTRAPAPMRLTLCNGVPTFDRGFFTGTYPGRIAGEETYEAVAEAAE